MNKYNQIEIIASDDVRYIGTLHAINSKNQTISLKNITHYGTEDRETTNPISPLKELIDYQIFSDKEIKALKVLNNDEGFSSSSKKRRFSESEESEEEKKGSDYDSESEDDAELRDEEVKESKGYYAKDGFFDNISNSCSKSVYE